MEVRKEAITLLVKKPITRFVFDFDGFEMGLNHEFEMLDAIKRWCSRHQTDLTTVTKKHKWM